MVLSAKAKTPLTIGLAATLSISLCVVLTGCDTTQQKAARLKVRNERQLDDRKPVTVSTVAPGITVLGTSIVRAGKRAAVAVEVQNTGTEPVTDLPISLEIEKGKKLVAINGKPKSFYQTHVPAIGPGGTTTWVFAGKEPVPPGGQITARVGEEVDPLVTATDKTSLEVSGVTTTPGKSGSAVEAEVHNPNKFPQYNVPVFAWAREGSRLIAAGQTQIDEVPPGDTESVTVKLVGDPGSAQVQVFAPTTIFE